MILLPCTFFRKLRSSAWGWRQVCLQFPLALLYCDCLLKAHSKNCIGWKHKNLTKILYSNYWKSFSWTKLDLHFCFSRFLLKLNIILVWLQKVAAVKVIQDLKFQPKNLVSIKKRQKQNGFSSFLFWVKVWWQRHILNIIKTYSHKMSHFTFLVSI